VCTCVGGGHAASSSSMEVPSFINDGRKEWFFVRLSNSGGLVSMLK
jgi:hypothetical protein